MDLNPKILSVTAVDAWVAEQRRTRYTIGYTCGAFDILHAGHVDYLERARSLCDRLLVAVNSDRSIQRYKNALRPINPEFQRMTVVAALASVDAVTLLEDVRPLTQLERWRPDLYIKGGDYEAAKLRSAAVVEQYGGRVAVLPMRFDISTSKILEAVAATSLHAPPPPDKAVEKIVCLDRDGTLIRDVPFLNDPAQVELLPGVGEGLAELQRLGFALVLITNQQGIALGYYGVREFIAVNQAMFRLLEPFGVKISRIFFCPHSAAEACACRKPNALLLEQALAWYGVKPENAYMIGDRSQDVEAGDRAGCRSILVGGGDGDVQGSHRRADSFADAVRLIKEEQNS
jgi:rfaE bifunctional protein nucleotidyltransferase chain/domain